MKKYLPVIVILLLVYGYAQFQDSAPSGPSGMEAELALQHAFANQQSDVQVKGVGKGSWHRESKTLKLVTALIFTGSTNGIPKAESSTRTTKIPSDDL